MLEKPLIEGTHQTKVIGLRNEANPKASLSYHRACISSEAVLAG